MIQNCPLKWHIDVVNNWFIVAKSQMIFMQAISLNFMQIVILQLFWSPLLYAQDRSLAGPQCI